MNIQELSTLVNDLHSAREETNMWKLAMDALLEYNEEYQELKRKHEIAQRVRMEKQNELLRVMKDEKLKSWKTDDATVSMAKRMTVGIAPGADVEIKRRLQAGEHIPYVQLNITEYLSIRTPKHE